MVYSAAEKYLFVQQVGKNVIKSMKPTIKHKQNTSCHKITSLLPRLAAAAAARRRPCARAAPPWPAVWLSLAAPRRLPRCTSCLPGARPRQEQNSVSSVAGRAGARESRVIIHALGARFIGGSVVFSDSSKGGFWEKDTITSVF